MKIFTPFRMAKKKQRYHVFSIFSIVNLSLGVSGIFKSFAWGRSVWVGPQDGWDLPSLLRSEVPLAENAVN